MLLVENLDEIIELAIYSGYIAKEKPISLLLVANPEAGKTKLVEQYKLNSGLVFISDSTPVGLVNKYSHKLNSGEIKHFVFTDLITPISKSSESRSAFVTFLNGLVEEGLYSIHTHFMNLDIRIPKPIGIIACIAPNPLLDNRHNWASIGFMSRLLPISWRYSENTKHLILDSILNNHQDQDIRLDLPDRELDINLDYDLAKKLYPLALQLNIDSANNPYGFRLMKQLHALVKASALKDKRDQVQPKDIDKIKTLSEFMNFSYNEI
jgi:hypothetical protein